MNVAELRATVEPVPCSGWERYRHPPHRMEVYATSTNPRVTYRCPTCERRVRYKELSNGTVKLTHTKKGKTMHDPLPADATVPGTTV